MSKNFFFSLLPVLALFGILFPFTSYLPNSTPISRLLFLLGTSVLTWMLSYYLLEHQDLSCKYYLILIALKQCHLSAIVKARMVIFLLFQTASEGVELKFSVTVEEYIKLLAAAIKLVKDRWCMTYTLPLEQWHKFGKFASEYNDELKSRADIYKVRFAIPPDGVLNKKVIGKAVLVTDSVAAGVEVRIYDKNKLKEKIAIEEWDDFALADDIVAIVGGIMSKDSSLSTKINVKLISGSKCSPYIQQIANLNRTSPITTFEQ